MLIYTVYEDLLSAIDCRLTDTDFDRHALSLLRWQAECNPVYRRFLQGLGLQASHLGHWLEFPALPASAFRDHIVTTFQETDVAVRFETSGTSSRKTGNHYMADLRFYEKAVLQAFQFFMPDLIRHHWISLIPRFEDRPHSSLSYMFHYLARKIPVSNPDFFCGRDYQLDLAGLACCLSKPTDRPIALFGTSFALAAAAEYFSADNKKWTLPADSVVFDTGGYKGRHRELPVEELIRLLTSVFGFTADRVYNEYGMTELSSQGYALLSEGIHRFPPWLKAVIRDPVSGKVCPPGKKGLVQLYDLANVGSVMAVGTLDLGMQDGSGLRLLGRISTSDLRGCSLPYEL